MFSIESVPVERAQDSVIVTSIDGTIVDWNAGAERIYGYTREEALGLSVRQLYPSDADRFGELMETALAAGQVSFEKSAVREDGLPIRVSGSIVIIRDEAGEPTAAVGITRDIGAAQRLLEQLPESDRRSTPADPVDATRTLGERCAYGAIDSARALAEQEGDAVDECLVLLMLKKSKPRVTTVAYGECDEPGEAGVAFAIELLANVRSVLNALGKDIEVVPMPRGGDG